MRRYRDLRCDPWFELAARPAPGTFRLHRHLMFAGALASVVVGLWILGDGPASGESKVFAAAIILTGAAPLWGWLCGLDHGVPLMGFFGMVYAAQYAIPIFLLRNYVGAKSLLLPDRPLSRALATALAGLLCALLGYYGPQHWLIDGLVPRINLRWTSGRRVRFWGIAFSVLGLVVFIGEQTLKLPLALTQFGVFGDQLCSVGVCMLCVLHLTGGLDTGSVLFVLGIVVPSRVLLGLASGQTASGFHIVLLLLILYATLKHVLPWKAIIVGGMAVMLARPMMDPFRALTWDGGIMDDAPPIEKMAAFASVARDSLTRTERYDYSFQYTLLRLTCTIPLAEVLHDTPEPVPYWGGATFYPLLFKPIPRLLYSNKPTEDSGHDFGHRYDLIGRGDYHTSMNLPQLVELYANFGLAGVLIGMTLYGLTYRILLRMFVHPGMGVGGLIAAVYVAEKFLAIESSASLMFGGLLWVFPFFALIHLLVDSRPARTRGGQSHIAPANV